MKDVLIQKFENDVKKRSRLFRFLLVLDQMCNVVFWNGSQDETVSSHIGRRIENGTATWFDKRLCCLLKRLEKNHCNLSVGEQVSKFLVKSVIINKIAVMQYRIKGGDSMVKPLIGCSTNGDIYA